MEIAVETEILLIEGDDYMKPTKSCNCIRCTDCSNYTECVEQFFILSTVFLCDSLADNNVAVSFTIVEFSQIFLSEHNTHAL